MSRILLYCKDIQILTGKSESGARRVIAKIKLQFNRKQDTPITIDDFSAFYEIAPESVSRTLHYYQPQSQR